jgi:hypothetical protein
MSSLRRRPASRLSAFALAASTVFLCLAPANAAQPFEQKGRLCAPAAEMSVLSGALAAGGYLDQTLASAGAIPITYVASFAQALRYRTVHPPIDGANLTEVRTLASMAV